ncbi:hypothetical protein [Pseudomonas putida]|uniref:hypothetical protein n=1 Tax=Pseudomonas putida TaxID=303 RepID=UPI000CD41999|nr:hypothetical protein [Pseudomonas putida]POF97674.1 hypothetical protein BGP81_13495 [Pseudomonas putida]
MAEFKALSSGSQGSAEQVLFLNTEASPSEIFENATHRLESARDMLEVLAGLNSIADDRALPAISRAAALLVNDAHSLFDSLYDVVHTHEQLVKDYAVLEADLLQR